MADIFGITESMEAMKPIIEEAYKKSLQQIATDVFNSGGTTHGRNWKPLTFHTIARKKALRSPPLFRYGESINIRSGKLYGWITNPDNTEPDNYISNLPETPIYRYATEPRREQGNYHDANELRKFDDFGQTEDDERFIEAAIGKALQKIFGSENVSYTVYSGGESSSESDEDIFDPTPEPGEEAVGDDTQEAPEYVPPDDEPYFPEIEHQPEPTPEEMEQMEQMWGTPEDAMELQAQPVEEEPQERDIPMSLSDELYYLRNDSAIFNYKDNDDDISGDDW